MEEADIGPESTCATTCGGKGNGEDSFGFGLAVEGASGLKDGGGGSPNARGGVEVCGRGGGELDEEDMDATAGFERPGPPGALAGVSGRDGTRGGAKGGIAGEPDVGGGDTAAVGADNPDSEPRGPKSPARSMEAPAGEPVPDPALVGLLIALTGRTVRGALGGGARGGGSAGTATTGSRFVLTNFSKASAEFSSASSAALGTMSDRNSRSSEDKASELCGLPPMLLRRENLFRNRETADGAGGVPERSCTGSGAVEYDDIVGGVAASVCAGDCKIDSLRGDGNWATLPVIEDRTLS